MIERAEARAQFAKQRHHEQAEERKAKLLLKSAASLMMTAIDGGHRVHAAGCSLNNKETGTTLKLEQQAANTKRMLAVRI